MRSYSLTHLGDAVLARDLATVVSHERIAIASVLAHIAEFDARRLYLPVGYPSMYDYCVGKLRLSEQAAKKRLRAGRTARRFPAIFEAVAEGRLHLSGVILLSPHLTPNNAGHLVAAAEHRSRSEIEQLLAQRFPKPDVPTRLEAGAPPPGPATEQVSPGTLEFVPAQRSPGTAEAPAPRSKVEPLSPERFALQFTIGQATYEKLQQAQALLSHAMPSGDIGGLFDRALDALIPLLERRKLAATAKPRARSCRSSANPRHVPAHVKRAVWERDGRRCTFVGETGQRCPSRKFLELDHIDPVARGGQATEENLRIVCRSHNHYSAELTFGAAFMHDRREAARRAAAEARRAAAVEAEERAMAQQQARDVMACLTELGFRAGEARRAAEFSETLRNATLEQRVRAALKFLCPKARTHGRVESSSGVTGRTGVDAEQGHAKAEVSLELEARVRT